jgi:hypothetical protein
MFPHATCRIQIGASAGRLRERWSKTRLSFGVVLPGSSGWGLARPARGAAGEVWLLGCTKCAPVGACRAIRQLTSHKSWGVHTLELCRSIDRGLFLWLERRASRHIHACCVAGGGTDLCLCVLLTPVVWRACIVHTGIRPGRGARLLAMVAAWGGGLGLVLCLVGRGRRMGGAPLGWGWGSSGAAGLRRRRPGAPGWSSRLRIASTAVSIYLLYTTQKRYAKAKAKAPPGQGRQGPCAYIHITYTVSRRPVALLSPVPVHVPCYTTGLYDPTQQHAHNNDAPQTKHTTQHTRTRHSTTRHTHTAHGGGHIYQWSMDGHGRIQTYGERGTRLRG